MKILNINSYYFSSSIYKPMEESLINTGIDITTYAPIQVNHSIREETSSDVKDFVTVSVCYKKNDRLIFHRKHRKIKKDLLTKFDVNKYDILHAHSLFTNGYVAYAAFKKYNIPYIVAVRATDLNTFFKKMPHLRRIGIKILKNASKVIFLSEKYQKQLIEKYIPSNLKKDILEKSIVIPNGIDNFWFENKVENPKAKPKQRLKVIYVGNDSKRKNLTTLIKACSILNQDEKVVELLVVGKVENKTLKKKIGEVDFVKYTGRVDKNELLQLYQQNDIFVLPSISETFGLVYAEAMSQGLPVIYAKDQGFDGQFEEGEVGFSIECLNPSDIAKKIIMTLHQYNEISNNCIKLVNKFKWQSIAKEYKDIYLGIK